MFHIRGALANGPGYALEDSKEARYVFHLADKNQDYLLEKSEFHQVFLDFDLNRKSIVTPFLKLLVY